MPNIIYYHVLLGFYVNQSKIYKYYGFNNILPYFGQILLNPPY